MKRKSISLGIEKRKIASKAHLQTMDLKQSSLKNSYASAIWNFCPSFQASLPKGIFRSWTM